MKRLVVVGGGISGLAAAWGARRRSAAVLPGGLEVLVLEREATVGGKVLSWRQDGWLVEGGPTGYLDAEPLVRELAADVGLTPVAACQAAARRFVVRRGRPVEIRPSPLAFVRSRILGPLGLGRLVLEPLVKRRAGEEEESVWDFAARRLGRQVADRLISPMMLGIFAGDARALSLPAAFPRLAQIEREHGSLIRGLVARRRQGRSGGGGPTGPAGQLSSFEPGLAALPEAVARAPGILVRRGAAVAALQARASGGFDVWVEGDAGPVPADAVILTGEPWAMAPLLQGCAPAAARELDSIPCPPVLVVALGFGAEVLESVPRGFGVLIPRGEGYRILGCLWDTHLFPGRSPSGHLLLRAMLGGGVDPEAADLSDEALVEVTRKDLHRLLGIASPPVLVRVIRWPRAIPQYELGHLAKAKAIEESLARVPGLFLAGNALHGIAFAKAAALGVRRGEEAVELLSRVSP